jgi:hypothetical protein
MTLPPPHRTAICFEIEDHSTEKMVSSGPDKLSSHKAEETCR